MNEAQSTSADLQILSKIKQVLSKYLWHSQHLEGRGFRGSEARQEPDVESASGQPQMGLELLMGCDHPLGATSHHTSTTH